jgi:hypothetical protein
MRKGTRVPVIKLSAPSSARRASGASKEGSSKEGSSKEGASKEKEGDPRGRTRGLLVTITFLGAVGAACAGTIACQSAVNLDVKYDTKPTEPDGGDASVSTSPGAAPDGGTGSVPGDDGSAPVADASPPPGDELEGCPCDETQGLSCCVSAVGPSFCTTDHARCDGEQGAFYGCFGRNASTESVCCWTGSGALAVTAYASECKDGHQTACTTADDCPSGLQCVTALCGKVKIGACGVAPVCPPGTASGS